MRRYPSRRALTLIGALLALNVGFVAAYAAGLRINATSSMPIGIYRVEPLASGMLRRGTVVAICPSSAIIAVAAPRGYFLAGPCPGNVEPLLKHVAAVSGDIVRVSDRGVAVNGRALPNSVRLSRDCAGRPLARIPAGRYQLGPGSVWLYAPVPHSWDSRYFGPQPATAIVGAATPVLIVGNGRACGA